MEHPLGHRNSRTPLHRPRLHHPEYNRYREDLNDYREPHRARQSFDNLRYVEDEYPAQPPAFRPDRRRPSKLIPFNEAIGQLAGVLAEAKDFFPQFRDEFEGDIERVRIYVDDNVINDLWTKKIGLKTKIDHHRGRKEEDQAKDQSLVDECLGRNKQFRTICARLDKSLLAAAYAKPIISLDLQSSKDLLDEARIKRALNKLLPTGKECMDLINQAKTQYDHFSALLKELDFIRLIVDEWPEFASPENRTASPRSHDGDYDDRMGDEGHEVS